MALLLRFSGYQTACAAAGQQVQIKVRSRRSEGAAEGGNFAVQSFSWLRPPDPPCGLPCPHCSTHTNAITGPLLAWSWQINQNKSKVHHPPLMRVSDYFKTSGPRWQCLCRQLRARTRPLPPVGGETPNCALKTRAAAPCLGAATTPRFSHTCL